MKRKDLAPTIFSEKINRMIQLDDQATESALEIQSKNDVKQLEALMDAKNKDHAGYDPFHLREYSRQEAKEVIPSLEEVIERFSLSRQATDKHSEPPTGARIEARIPPYIHLHWGGGDLLDPRRWKNINELKKLNPDWKIILWVDQPDTGIATDNPMVKMAAQQGVDVINIPDVFTGNMNLWDEYRMGMLWEQYAISGDIFRLEVLDRYGGIYIDSDNLPLKSFSTIEAEKGVLFNAVRNKQGDIAGYNNDFIVAHANHPLFPELFSELRRKLGLTMAEVVEGEIYDFGVPSVKIADYEEAFFYMDMPHMVKWKDFIKNYVIKSTGIKSAIDYFNEQGSIPTEYHIPDQYIKSFCYGAWIQAGNQKDKFNGDRLLAIKHLLTIMLFELKIEPRFLYLDKYASLCRAYGIGDTILELLHKHYPHLLKQVEYASVFKACEFKSSVDLLFDKRIFSSLKAGELEYYENLFYFRSPNKYLAETLARQNPKFQRKYIFNLVSHSSTEDAERVIKALDYFVRSNNVDVNSRDSKGMTLLDHACSYPGRSLLVIEYLLYKGANVSGLNKQGKSSLYILCENLREFFYLDINKSEDRKTADRLVEIMTVMIKNGADIDLNPEGKKSLMDVLQSNLNPNDFHAKAIFNVFTQHDIKNTRNKMMPVIEKWKEMSEPLEKLKYLEGEFQKIRNNKTENGEPLYNDRLNAASEAGYAAMTRSQLMDIRALQMMYLETMCDMTGRLDSDPQKMKRNRHYYNDQLRQMQRKIPLSYEVMKFEVNKYGIAATNLNTMYQSLVKPLPLGADVNIPRNAIYEFLKNEDLVAQDIPRQYAENASSPAFLPGLIQLWNAHHEGEKKILSILENYIRKNPPNSSGLFKNSTNAILTLCAESEGKSALQLLDELKVIQSTYKKNSPLTEVVNFIDYQLSVKTARPEAVHPTLNRK